MAERSPKRKKPAPCDCRPWARGAREELDMLLWLSTFRYALGRQTYIVQWFCTEARRAWPMLTANVRELIEDELGSEILRDAASRNSGGAYHPLGRECDRGEWVALHNWITQPREGQ